MLNVVVGGIASGLVYGLIGVGLVLLYKGTKTLNFAQGQIGLVGTYVGFTMSVTMGLPVIVALFGAMAFGALLALVIELTVIRPLGPENMLAKGVATLGLLLVLTTLINWVWFPDPATMPGLFPSTGVDVFGADVTYTSLGTLGICLLVLALLVAFFRWHPLGLAVRANADNPAAASLVGMRPGVVSATVWAITGALAALAGMLLAPTAFLSAHLMTPPLLKGMAAAVVGGFMSLPGAVIGGLLIGISENLLAYWVAPGWKTPFAFIVLFAVLIVRPTGLIAERTAVRV